MDNANKAEKIAAAKKKLKHFQQRSKTKVPEIRRQNSNDDDKLSTDNPELELESPIQVTNSVTQSHEDDLAQQIEKLKQENEKLLSSNEQSQELNRKLQNDLNEKVNDSGKDARESELERTISILIEEKNDLIGANQQLKVVVENFKEELKEKEESVTMMKVKLANSDTSTANVMVLKAELSTLAEERNTLQQELKTRNQLYDNVCEEHTELKNRSENQMKTLNQSEATVKQLKSELELMNLNMQQLKNDEVADKNIDITQKEQDCEKIVTDLKEQIGKLTMEKDVLAQQYQQYILRLNVQLRSMSSQVELLAAEKRNIETTSQMNLDRITELEAIIANMQKTTQVNQTSTASESEVKSHKEEIAAQLHSNTELDNLQKQISDMTNDNDQLAKLVLEKESRIQELEIRVDRIQNELDLVSSSNNDTVEREKLLQAMQNDKTAASRAIAQNRQLKMQLEELEKAFIQLSNDKLALTEQSQTALSQNKEYRDKISLIEPELIRLREQVSGLSEQQDAIIYWRQELEEAHERIEALTHQNSEMKKRVIWNLSQSPRKNTRRHNNDDDSSSSPENDEDLDWVPSEEHEKLRFHYSQLEQQLKRNVATVTSLTEEKQNLEHLVLQLQSETETIGEYVSLYQVQRGQLRRRAQQLTSERLALKERTEKLIRLLPQLAPQLEKLPQWNRLVDTEGSTSAEAVEPEETQEIAAVGVISVLLEICSSGEEVCANELHVTSSDALHLDENMRAPHENFHPCQVCSGRLMTV